VEWLHRLRRPKFDKEVLYATAKNGSRWATVEFMIDWNTAVVGEQISYIREFGTHNIRKLITDGENGYLYVSTFESPVGTLRAPSLKAGPDISMALIWKGTMFKIFRWFLKRVPGFGELMALRPRDTLFFQSLRFQETWGTDHLKVIGACPSIICHDGGDSRTADWMGVVSSCGSPVMSELVY
jgi:hypothetical protein